MATLTWLGHASFRVDTDGGERLYVDPFRSGPTWPADEQVERADAIVVTHGHGDHAADVADLQRSLGCKVLAIVELARWFTTQGVPQDAVVSYNKGGTVEVGGVRVTMTNAFHSSSAEDGTYTGEPSGAVLRFGDHSVYFAGDTCVFGDMQLIARLYRPTVAVLPIGGHFTMDPEEAAVALELLGKPRCVPCHWGTFPPLVGRPAQLAALTDARVEELEPGDTVEL
jgi:L-ascorbate metabolism protein UlaG (beta-lactamase superfamily)